MLGLTSSVALLTAAVSPGEPVQWSRDEGGNGHIYQVVSVARDITWEAAREQAHALGARLVSIESAEENEFIYSLLDRGSHWELSPTGDSQGPWIGLRFERRAAPGGEWAWDDGTSLSFAAWAAGEPDGGLNMGAQFWADGLAPEPTWRDARPDERAPAFVIEFAIEENREYDAAPSDADETSSAPAERKAVDRQRRGETIRIDLQGRYGEHIIAGGIRSALEVGRRVDAQRVLFVFDTPGGVGQDARAIGRVLRQFQDDFEYHAVIKRCFSAGIITLVWCEKIWVHPDAPSGAAVGYSKNPATGAIEVDAKVNSALAAKIGSRAHATGHPPELFEAMVVMEREAWMTRDGIGRPRFHASRPSDDLDAIQIDSASTVLSLRADQMVEFDIADPLPRGLESLPASYGELRDLTPRLRRVVKDMRESERRIRVLKAEIDQRQATAIEQAAWIERRAEAARRADPRRLNLFYYESGPNAGELTPESKAKWRRHCDKSRMAWEAALRGLYELNALYKQAERLEREIWSEIQTVNEAREWPAERPTIENEDWRPKIAGDALAEEARSEIAWMKRHRGRQRIDE